MAVPSTTTAPQPSIHAVRDCIAQQRGAVEHGEHRHQEGDGDRARRTELGDQAEIQ
jgi:hypothetical protein